MDNKDIENESFSNFIRREEKLMQMEENIRQIKREWVIFEAEFTHKINVILFLLFCTIVILTIVCMHLGGMI